MKINHVTRCVLSLIVTASLLFAWARVVQADIMGFGDFSNFTFNQSDGASGPTVNPTTATVQLTSNASYEVRSVFDDTRQNINQFTASFVFQAVGMPTNTSGFGACFVVQNETVNDVASNNEGIADQYGISDWNGTFGNSVAISLEYTGGTSSATALYTAGNVGGGDRSSSPVNAFSGDPIQVTLSYNGTLLHEHLLDTLTTATFDGFYATNIASAILSPTAYVGITANTTNTAGAMEFSDFEFSNGTVTPEPSSWVLMGLGAGALCFVRRRAARRRCLNVKQPAA